MIRKALVLVVGLSVLFAGIAMIALPGPAILFIPAGLAILATEFDWAKRWLKKLREQTKKVGESVRRTRREKSDEHEERKREE
jgi:tellurite resistance protein TerC